MSREKNAWFRMVVSYWEMAAALVTCGAIDQEMFNATGGGQGPAESQPILPVAVVSGL